ncbi:MAG: VOC family protein [Pseudomonadota bacterium]
MSLDYLMLGSNDVPKARAFYDEVFPKIGGKLVAEHMPHAFCYKLRGGAYVWIAQPYDKGEAVPGNGGMLGLKCESKEQVDEAHKLCLTLGATDEGAPGPRPAYGPSFYGGYVRDLDGNKMSFVIY